MKKKAIAMISIVICLSLCESAFAALGSSAFVTKNMYSRGHFNDVDEACWYGFDSQGVIKQAYELGLMTGISNDQFQPERSLLVSEALKMACVVHSIYNGGDGAFDQNVGNNWYDVYTQYAVSKRIISANEIMDYSSAVTRSQMAHFFFNCVPSDALNAINTCASIPDTDENDNYYYEILTLYKAGVLTGSDAYGTFGASEPTTRAAAAAIISRIAVPSLRKTFTLLPKPELISEMHLSGELLVGTYQPKQNYSISVTSSGGLYYVNAESYRMLYDLPQVNFTENVLLDVSDDCAVAYYSGVPWGTYGEIVFTIENGSIYVYVTEYPGEYGWPQWPLELEKTLLKQV